MGESTPTEAEYEVPLPLVEVGVSRLDDGSSSLIVYSDGTQPKHSCLEQLSSLGTISTERWDSLVKLSTQ